MYDLEMMTELGYCSGIENYSRHLEGRKEGERPSTRIDFFSDEIQVSAIVLGLIHFLLESL